MSRIVFEPDAGTAKEVLLAGDRTGSQQAPICQTRLSLAGTRGCQVEIE